MIKVTNQSSWFRLLCLSRESSDFAISYRTAFQASWIICGLIIPTTEACNCHRIFRICKIKILQRNANMKNVNMNVWVRQTSALGKTSRSFRRSLDCTAPSSLGRADLGRLAAEHRAFRSSQLFLERSWSTRYCLPKHQDMPRQKMRKTWGKL